MTMILLPPVGLDAGCWDWLDLPDAAEIKHVYPGFGTRPRGEFRLTLSDIADEVVTLADGPLDLVGVSMGAMVAQHAAIRHPDRVRSISTLGCPEVPTCADALPGWPEIPEIPGFRGVSGPRHGPRLAEFLRLCQFPKSSALMFEVLCTREPDDYLGKRGAPLAKS